VDAGIPDVVFYGTNAIMNPEPHMKRMKILVVDDIQEIAEFLQEMLETEHDVQVETCATRALELGTSGRFDLVVTDYNMPVVNGQILAQAIAAQAPATRVVFLTGSEDSRSIAGTNPSVVTTLRKPLRLAELHSMLEIVSKHFEATP